MNLAELRRRIAGACAVLRTGRLSDSSDDDLSWSKAWEQGGVMSYAEMHRHLDPNRPGRWSAFIEAEKDNL